MDLSPFKALPDGARLWIFAFERPLGADDSRMVTDRLTTFMDEWHTHRKDVTGAFAIYHDQFVILSGASADGMSGCSVDSSIANFKYFRDEHGLNGLNRNLVYYRDETGEIQTLERATFKAKVDTGECGSDTPVFDTTTPALGDLRAGRFEIPMRESWHARAFMQTPSES